MKKKPYLTGTLNDADLDAIERVVYKNGDDLAVSAMRMFERLKGKMDTIEIRLKSSLDAIEDALVNDPKND